MMPIEDVKAENQRNYLKLIVALEASQGILNLLIAVCDDSNLRETIIRQYETELQQQNFLSYRIQVRWQDPSLRYALAQLLKNEPPLQQRQPAVITVLGIDGLLSAKLDAQKSEQDRFFGYLQWTREALREFTFPIVLWVSEPILVSLAQRAPDFWSWRGGVFWFTREPTAQTTNNYEFSSSNVLDNPIKNPSKETSSLPLEEILRLIEQIEAQGEEAPLLATLYDSLANAYQQRGNSHQNRQMAIQAYEKAISLEKKLNLKTDLAESLFRLGNLYFERKDNVKQADNCFQQALEIFRFVGDKQGEANTVEAIGDVLQFLDRREEALNHYEAALSFYREIGDKQGEANTLKAIGDVMQFLKRTQEALNRYETALSFYREIGDKLGEANTIKAIGDVLQFLKRTQEALNRYETALSFYREIGDKLGEANTLRAIGDVLQFLKRTQEALNRYETALSFYREIGAKLGEANTLIAIGDVLQFLKRTQEALNRYETALSFYREIGDKQGEANTLIAIGDVLQFLDRREEALNRYETALSFYREIGDKQGEANVLQEFGKLAQPAQALQYLQQAQHLYVECGDIYSQSRNLLFIAEAFLNMRNKEGAYASLTNALHLATSINNNELQEYAQKQIRFLQEQDKEFDF
ncbi:hypothetical protein NIES4105_92570 [Calothrix sp. NIES-4105]|nr:hypothetical protein NIES4105_92570 [Calothrix sp. NIES-4105]